MRGAGSRSGVDVGRRLLRQATNGLWTVPAVEGSRNDHDSLPAMRDLPRPLRQIFRPMTPRSSVIEQGLVLTSILAAVVLAVMALVVHRINDDAAEAGKRSIRSVEVAATLDKLQLSLRDADMAGGLARARDGVDAERFDSARFQARLQLNALGPLANDEPSQSERLSRLAPLVNRKLGFARGNDATSLGTRDDIDGLIAAMRDDEGRRLDRYRATQREANEKSTAIMVGSLALVSLLSVVFWVLLKIEFAARRALERRLIESATTDELTGVANRSDFDRKLVQEWTFRNRYGTALSLLLIDVDHLKRHNDEWGHIAGDAILREVARRLSSRLKRTEVVARFGGDEFAVIVPQYRKEAVAIAEQLRELIAEVAFHLQGLDRPVSVDVTVSIGVAEASDVESPRQLLAAVDEAMYAAKERGRNAVAAFQPNPTIGGTHARLQAATGMPVQTGTGSKRAAHG